MNEEKIDVNGLDEDLVVLTTDDGVEHNFYHVATVDYKNEWYVFFQPAEEIPDIDEDEVVIFRLEEDENGEDLFVPIEDENLLNEVYEEYVRMAEEEDECGCGCGCHEDGCDCEGEENQDAWPLPRRQMRLFGKLTERDGLPSLFDGRKRQQFFLR